MQILRNIAVPTGNILIVSGDKGKLECLSLFDYGKEKNVKADFMGLKREITNVAHTSMLPLEEKWVVTISTQYGCSMGCRFCDVPKVGPGINATKDDLINQVLTGLSLHPEVQSTKRLNIHYARMGEPSWNWAVVESAKEIRKAIFPVLGRSLVHPVVSTMMPRANKNLSEFINAWMDVKNDTYRGDAGLQISVNSTNEDERRDMFRGSALTLKEIAAIVDREPRGRKITLNFAIAGYEINPDVLLELFDPKKFLIKLTPMHKTSTAQEHGIETAGDYTSSYPYQHHEEALKKAGYDVLVFVGSIEEDLGRITCGNAILSGSVPLTTYHEVIDKHLAA
jgi:23S rRNA (adenine2503-C2)-methyltransferase